MVAQRTALYYASIFLKYKVQTQCHSLPQKCTPVLRFITKYDTPVLLCATKQCYKIHFRHYSELHNSFPILQTTTKVLRLQNYIPMLLCTTHYYNNTTTHYPLPPQHRVLQRTSQYHNVQLRYDCKISFTMRRTRKRTTPLHRTLCLPRKINIIIYPRKNTQDYFKYTEQNKSPSKYQACHSKFERKLSEKLPSTESDSPIIQA